MSRDFTKRQFREAAQRNGFTLGPFGLLCLNADGTKGLTSYGYCCQSRPFKVLRRLSLAEAIRKREHDKVRA